MDDERSREIGAQWAMGLTAIAALVFVLATVAPHAKDAFAHAAKAGPLFGQVARTGLIAGTVAGSVGWLVGAALTRTAMLRRGLVFVLVLAAVTALAGISTAGWVRTSIALERVFALRHVLSHPVPVMPTYRRQMAEDREAYQQELLELEYPRFLAPAALATAEGRANAQTKLTLSRAVVAKYQALYRARVQTLKEGLTDPVVAKRLEAALAPELAARLDWWKVTDQILAEDQSVIQDLSLAKAPFEVKKGKFFFRSRSDFETFRDHVATIKKLEEREHQLDLAVAHASDTTDTTMLASG